MGNEYSDHFDRIGPWSEIKLEIIKKYVKAYSTILSKQAGFKHIYIDAFAGAGANISRTTGEMVLGSPLNALLVEPPFYEYHLVDHNGKKVESLRHAVNSCKYAKRTKIYRGDCNEILINKILPKVKYDDFWRGLCLLDPYGLHLDWKVFEIAGKMKTIDMLINFPIMDINRNPLGSWTGDMPHHASMRMTRFWGDESWRDELHNHQGDLFGADTETKVTSMQVVEAFRKRLKKVAGFKYVSTAFPIRTPKRQPLFFLMLASKKPVAANIIDDIFSKYV